MENKNIEKTLNQLAGQIGALSVNNTLLSNENQELKERVQQLEAQLKQSGKE